MALKCAERLRKISNWRDSNSKHILCRTCICIEVGDSHMLHPTCICIIKTKVMYNFIIILRVESLYVCAKKGIDGQWMHSDSRHDL